MTQGKPAVASIACAVGHNNRENPMAYVRSSGDNAFCLKSDTDVMALTFDAKINGFSEHIVEDLCAKFGDPSCIGV